MTTPWPEVVDLSRLYDHGAPWCINRGGHPDVNGGYPDAEVHLPHHECRSRSHYVDCVGKSGISTLELYVARPFRFGQERIQASGPVTQTIVLSAWGPDSDGQSCQLTQGDALLLARHLVSLVDDLNA